MYDISALGEMLIDFTMHGVSENGMVLFEQNPGGAVVNVLCAAANFGMRTAFIGKVGCDMHGRFLKETLNKMNVSTKGMIEADNVYTTLAFVALSDTGERSFSFARKPGADTCLTPEELDGGILEHSCIFHVGSLSLTHEPSRSATLKAIQTAKKAGAIISYDPNYRASLWENETNAAKQMRSLLPYADIMKLSDDETYLLTGEKDPEKALDTLIKEGISLAAVTLGSKGALAAIPGGKIEIKGFSCNVVDTTGAGDAFWGGFLYGFVKSGKKLEELALDDAAAFARFGNAAAALCIEKRGAIPAMPSLEMVEALLIS